MAAKQASKNENERAAGRKTYDELPWRNNAFSQMKRTPGQGEPQGWLSSLMQACCVQRSHPKEAPEFPRPEQPFAGLSSDSDSEAPKTPPAAKHSRKAREARRPKSR
eukprot:gnl/TRDRNA2_/TRDRNA2_185709_c0_seq1.p1 gnl/TRDRNA2_/TRDRNA2_185709_c0~~gnl/TRDRNA2_/TRDRNA2_185709_c0_seq1.p1  ORF type:complete len:124 (-),score=10.63 gnl/TRDRNA2_/TRDRNA2_185709_c0_seq1:44-364(-)